MTQALDYYSAEQYDREGLSGKTFYVLESQILCQLNIYQMILLQRYRVGVVFSFV